MAKNADRIGNAKSLPNFIKDNPEVAEKYTGVEIANKAHKYGRDKFDKSQILDNEEMLAVYDKSETPIEFTEEQKRNNVQIAKFFKETGQGIPKPHFRANCGNVNPDLNFAGGKHNCAMCSFTYELRRRGFSAKSRLLSPTDRTSYAWEAGEDYGKLWKGAEYAKAEANNVTNTADALRKCTKKTGRYHLAWDWDEETGHNIVAERFKDGTLVLYDAQISKYYDIDKYFKNVKHIDVYKIDKAEVNVEALKDIIEEVVFKKKGRK